MSLVYELSALEGQNQHTHAIVPILLWFFKSHSDENGSSVEHCIKIHWQSRNRSVPRAVASGDGHSPSHPRMEVCVVSRDSWKQMAKQGLRGRGKGNWRRNRPFHQLAGGGEDGREPRISLSACSLLSQSNLWLFSDRLQLRMWTWHWDWHSRCS